MKKTNSSMQLTRAADYGVRVMVYLARMPEQDRVMLPELAAAAQAPVSFLSKVLQALTRAKLIASWRGKAGGFMILPRGRRASMLQVIEAIDGPLFLNLCLTSKGACRRARMCPAHPVWEQAQQAMAGVLAAAVVNEMAGQPSLGYSGGGAAKEENQPESEAGLGPGAGSRLETKLDSNEALGLIAIKSLTSEAAPAGA
jgi:Rrf2 family protein